MKHRMRKISLLLLLMIVITNIYGQSCVFTNLELNTQGAIDSFAINYPGCSIIEGSLIVSGPNIVNLTGLMPIQEINGDLRIFHVTNLVSLHGLDSIHYITNKISISNNNIIEDFNNLNNLESVNSMSLIQLGNIDSIIGFFNLNWNILSGLAIFSCPNLTWCSSDAICNYINNGGNAIFNNNGSGCKSNSQVEYQCGLIDTLNCDTSFFQANFRTECYLAAKVCNILDLLDPGTKTGCLKLEETNWNSGEYFSICPEGGITYNPKWLGFYAFCDSISIDLKPTFCFGLYGEPGIQAALVSWDSIECKFSNPFAHQYLDCSGLGPSMEPIYLRSGDLEYGKLYYLVVAGWKGSICDIEITLNYACNHPPIGDWTEEIIGPDSVCVGEYVEFQVTMPEFGEYIEWSYKDSVAMGHSNSFFHKESNVNRCMTFDSPGIYTVCAKAGSFCSPYYGIDLCKTINVHACGEVPLIDTTYLCPGDFINIKTRPFSFPGTSSNYSGPGHWVIPIETSEGCDSVIRLIIEAVENYPIRIDDLYKCYGDTLTVHGNSYTDQGEYTYLMESIDSTSCDTIVHFKLIDLIIDVSIQSEANILVPGDSILLYSIINDSIGNSNMVFYWYDDSGSLLYFGPNKDSIYINIGGNYCLKVESWSPDSLSMCYDLDCIEIIVDSASIIQYTPNSGEFRFQPNPANEQITLFFPSDYKDDADVTIQVYNAVGQAIFDKSLTNSRDQVIIDSSLWPAGNYFIKGVIDGKFIITGWVMVMH